MRGGVGEAFIITPHSAWQPMGSWWPSGAVFPPQPGSEIWSYRNRNSRRAFAREVPVRGARHNPHSIATLRVRIARYLIHQLDRCPYCGSCGC